MSAAAARVPMDARLRRAALEAFAAEGFEGTTVAAICDRAGCAKGSLYNHFEGKEGLFIELMDEATAHFLRALREGADPDRPAPDRLRGMGRAAARVLGERIDLFTLFAVEAYRVSGSMRASLRVRAETVTAEVAGVVAEGCASGALRDLDPEETGGLFVDLVFSGVRRAAFEDEGLDETSIERAVEVFLEGIRPRRGEAAAGEDRA